MEKVDKIQRLVDCNCYEEWETNVRTKCVVNRLDYSTTLYDLLENSHSLYIFLGGSFQWGPSPQGFEYWYRVSDINLPPDYITP